MDLKKNIHRADRLLIVFIFLVGAGYTGSSQTDALGTLSRITAAYNSRAAIRFTGNMVMYRKNDPHHVIESMSANYLIQGTNVLCTFGPIQLLMNAGYYVSVDHAIRVMVIGRNRDLAETGQLPALNMGKLEQWVKENKIDATLLKDEKGAGVELSDVRQLSGFRRYQIRCSRQGFLTRVLMETSDYHTGSGPVMVLDVKYSEPTPANAIKQEFSERNFFSLSGNRPKLAAKFTGYQLINQL